MWLTGTPFTVSGLEQVPRGKPCVLVVNHASYLDGLVLMAVLPGPFGFVAKRELLERFILRVYLQRLGTEFVERFPPTRVCGMLGSWRVRRAPDVR
jgi:1-acyl-sn-glycerol-3-phosphate acyltransferase